MWSDTIRRVLGDSEAHCLVQSSRSCGCDSPAVTTSQVPLGIFYTPERCVVLVDSICGRERCRTRVRQDVLQMTSRFRWPDGGQSLYADPEAFTTVMC